MPEARSPTRINAWVWLLQRLYFHLTDPCRRTYGRARSGETCFREGGTRWCVPGDNWWRAGGQAGDPQPTVCFLVSQSLSVDSLVVRPMAGSLANV